MTKRALSHNSKPSIGPLRFEDRVRALAIASCSEIPGGSISTPTTRLAQEIALHSCNTTGRRRPDLSLLGD
jgi:hypothetical protein